MKKFYYFTEAGNRFGLGHIKRYEAISQLLPEIKIELLLYDKSDKSLSEQYWDNENISKIEKYISDSDAIFIDTFVASEQVLILFEKANKLIVIDDYVRRSWLTGLIIDWTLDAEKWRKKCGDISLFGFRYLVTRDAFRCYRWKKADGNKEFSEWNIGTVFGGSDNLNLTSNLYSTLKKHKYVSHFGTALYPLFEKYKFDDKFYWDLSENNFAKKISECDLVITAGGQMLYELARMGVPSICISTNDNQNEDYHAFTSNKLSIPCTLEEMKSPSFYLKIKNITYKDLISIHEQCESFFVNKDILANKIRSYLCL